jgi:glucose 1-dehydrogenase
LNAMNAKSAIITGAARGIGAATARELAHRGFDLVLVDRLPMDDTMAQVAEAGRRAISVTGSVTERAVNEEAVALAAKKFGRLDAVVANAARGLRKPFVEQDEESARSLFDVVFWAGFSLSQAAARQMIAQGGGGSIVFISSVHAMRGYATAIVYNAAKAAVNHLARTAALELAPHRIRVNWIEPGWVNTEGEQAHFGQDFIAQEGPKLAWGRLADPSEIAKGVGYLVTDDSSYVTGVGLRIDGGHTLPRPT